MSVIVHSVHNNIVHCNPMLFVLMRFSAMANIAIPGMGVTDRALLLHLSCASIWAGLITGWALDRCCASIVGTAAMCAQARGGGGTDVRHRWHRRREHW